MKVSTFGKIGASLVGAALIASAVVAPAMADPTPGSFGNLAGLGSDTTQDVMQAIAASSGGAIASYYAVGSTASPVSTSVQTRTGDSKTIGRFSGSGAGRDALRVAIGQIASATVAVSTGTTTTVNATVTPADVSGYIDFARSSGSAATDDQTSTGVLTYIPFAKDAVDVSFAGSAATKMGSVHLTIGTKDDVAGTTSLYAIYHGLTTQFFFNGDTFVSAGGPAATAPTGTTAFAVQPLLPKAGSGTRNFFIGKVGLAEKDPLTTSIANGGYGIKDKDTDGTTAIEEHDGTAVTNYTTGNTIAIAPYSVGQWVTQSNGTVTSRTHGAQLATLYNGATAVAPTTGSAGSYAVNPAYASDTSTKNLVRDVYNIVPTRQANDTTSAVYRAFVGASSIVCQATSAITTYGFITGPTGGCGNTDMKAYAPSTSTTTVSVATAAQVGSVVSATATINSVGNGGGSVIFKSGSTTFDTVSVAKGATSATSTKVPTTAAGAQSITAQFVPSLAGVASSTSAAAAFSVTTPTDTKTTPVVKAKITKVTLGAKGKLKVTIAGASGKVKVLEGKKVLVKKAILKGGKVTIKLPKFTKLGKHKLKVSYLGDATHNAVTQKVTVKVVR